MENSVQKKDFFLPIGVARAVLKTGINNQIVLKLYLWLKSYGNLKLVSGKECTMFSAQCTVFSAQCTVFSVQCIVFMAPYILCLVHNELFVVQNVLYLVQSILCLDQCVLSLVHIAYCVRLWP